MFGRVWIFGVGGLTRRKSDNRYENGGCARPEPVGVRGGAVGRKGGSPVAQALDDRFPVWFAVRQQPRSRGEFDSYVIGRLVRGSGHRQIVGGENRVHRSGRRAEQASAVDPPMPSNRMP